MSSYLNYVEASVANVPENLFEIRDLPSRYQRYQLLLEGLIAEAMKDSGAATPLTPSIPERAGGFAELHLRVHHDPSIVGQNLLVLFANLQQAGPPPAATVSFLPSGADFAMATSSVLFDRFKQEAIEKAFPNGFPGRLPNQPSLILRSLELQMMDGHIRVSGSATKEIDCWWDADLSFSGKVRLAIDPEGALVVRTDDVDVDMPWWADFLQFLLPPISTGIVAIVERSIESIIGKSIATQAHGIIEDMTLFEEEIASTATAVAGTEMPALIAWNAWIELRADALILAGYLIPVRKEDIGDNFTANIRTGELHRLGNDGCRWSRLIAPVNSRHVSLVRALKDGYNGCWYCFRWYDTDELRWRD